MFSSHFNYLVSVLNLKNTDISKALFVDRSLVSRWRTGKRTPNEEQVRQIAEVLVSSCQDVNARLALCRALSLQYNEKLFENRRHIQTILAQWLADDLDFKQPAVKETAAPVPDDIPHPISVSMYTGDNGYRYCFRTLLEMALQSGQSFELLFFGNGSLEWLTRQKGYLNTLGRLIRQAREQQIKIKLIFHISNDTKKMSNYVRLWSLCQSVPGTELCGLYGLANREDNRRLFSHINLIVPNVGAVTGWSVKESPHKYVSMINGQREIRNVTDDFNVLWAGSIPITQNHEKFSYDELLGLMTNENVIGISREFISHSHSLPLGTLPVNVLEQMLENAGATTEEIAHFCLIHQKFIKWFEDFTSKGTLEYYYVDRGLRHSRNFADSHTLFGYHLEYTKDLYLMHLKKTLITMEKCPNFFFYSLEKPLIPTNIHIAFGAYLISFGDFSKDEVVTSTHQHFSSCVFVNIGEIAKLLPERTFSRSHTIALYQAKYPELL